MKYLFTSMLISSFALASCGSPDVQAEVTIEDVAVVDLPDKVLELVLSAREGFAPNEVQKKTRDGRVYYDIEGELSDGSELEFDVLMTPEGPVIVETQRDLNFELVPDNVRKIALEVSGDVLPVRIIESVQADEAIIFEFFAEGRPNDPAYEVRYVAGEATLLRDRWEH